MLWKSVLTSLDPQSFWHTQLPREFLEYFWYVYVQFQAIQNSPQEVEKQEKNENILEIVLGKKIANFCPSIPNLFLVVHYTEVAWN